MDGWGCFLEFSIGRLHPAGRSELEEVRKGKAKLWCMHKAPIWVEIHGLKGVCEAEVEKGKRNRSVMWSLL